VELKDLITHFTYRIEPKPEGGFVAHASDPTVPPLEAPTRLELQQKIQATITAGLGAQFPALKPALEGKTTNVAFHIERKPEGGFALHSNDPQSQPIIAASQSVLESQFAEKLIGFVGRHFMPELAQVLASQGASGNITVSIKKNGMVVNTGSHSLGFGVAPGLAPAAIPEKNELAQPETAGSINPTFENRVVGNSPITPESSSNSMMFVATLVFAVLGAIAYLLLHR